MGFPVTHWRASKHEISFLLLPGGFIRGNSLALTNISQIEFPDCTLKENHISTMTTFRCEIMYSVVVF